MDSPLPRKTGNKAPWLEIVDRLAADRQRLVQFLIQRRDEIQESLTRLETWAANLSRNFQAARLEIRRREYEISTRADELARRENLIRALEEKLSERLYQWQLLEDQLRIQEQSLSDRLARLEGSIGLGVKQLTDQLRDWNRLKADVTTRLEQTCKIAQELGEEEGRVAALREELEYREKILGEKLQEIARREARTHVQRRLLARRFREEHKRLQQELQASTTASKEPANLNLIMDQLELFHRKYENLQQLLENLTTVLDRLNAGASSHQATRTHDGSRLAEERASSELQGGIKSRSESPGNSWQELAEDLSHRYELACEEIRALREEKEQIAEKYREVAARLEHWMQKSKQGGEANPDSPWDWQIEKQRLLSALEAEESLGSEEQRSDAELEISRLRRALAEAENLLSQKDQEICTLQQLLEEQSRRVGSLAVGAAALEELVAQDAIIQEERENARRLREEWEQKLRQAEVELSLERAKLARERAELEERARQLEEWARKLQQAEVSSSAQSSGTASPAAKSLRRKWFGQ